MSFREDGYAAVDWAARYLEGVGERPVLAQVQPGEVRAALPASPPERGEPFADVLRDLDEVLMPGITHWQSPALLRLLRDERLRAGDPRRAARGRAQPGRVPLAHLARVDELELLTLDWLAQLLGLPRGLARPHRGHGLDLDAHRADRGARA